MSRPVWRSYRGTTGDREGRERPAQAKEKGAARRVRQQFAVTSDRPRTAQRERRQDGCLPLRSRRAGAVQAVTTGAGVTSPPARAFSFRLFAHRITRQA